MADENNVSDLIKRLGTNKGRIPALSLVQSNPEHAANISKLIRDTTGGAFDISKKNSELNLNAAQMQSISESIRARTKDNEAIIQLFPDIELAIQIMVSSILSPKDMTKNELIYKTTEVIFPTELLAQLNDVVKTELDGHYHLKDHLQFILREVLYETGAHVRLVLPESIVDEMINERSQVSLEGMVDVFDDKKNIRNIGFLGNGFSNKDTKRTHALENFFAGTLTQDVKPKILMDTAALEEIDVSIIKEMAKIAPKGFSDKDSSFCLENLEVSDNFNFLKLPEVMRVGNRQKVKAITKLHRQQKSKYALEAIDNKSGKMKMSVMELSSVLYKDQSRDYEHLMVLPSGYNAKRRSVGRGLEMKIAPESVIPVFRPGNPSDHIGYFVMTDIEGNPVNRDSQNGDADGLAGLLANQSNNQNMSSLLIDKAHKNLVASNASPMLDNITAVYASIIENDLLERLRNGAYGMGASIANNAEIYRVMLARAIKGKMTRLIYVPVEYTSYFAVKYFPNGVGKSFMDDVKNLTSIRAILLFSKVMAQVKSSINVTKVKLKIDPMDPSPEKTIEMAQHEVAKMRQMYFPLGINSPVDLTDWIQRAGLEWEFEGHPGIPDTGFEFSTDNFKHELPDETLEENLRKQTYMAFGIPPEMVDNGFNAEFATTAVQNNILLSKRVANIQDIFVKQLTQHGCRIIRTDQVISEQLKDIFRENKGLLEKSLSDEEKTAMVENEENFYEAMVEKYLTVLSLELPRPDVTTLETQSLAFDKYEEAVGKAIEYWISEKVANGDFTGEIGSKMDALKDMYVAIKMREWMASNNYLPELADIINSDEDGEPIVPVMELQKTHTESLIRSFVGYAHQMLPIKEAADKDLQNMNVEPGDNSSTDTSTDTSGGGELGDLDFGSETPPEETTPEQPVEETEPEKSEEEPETPASDTEGVQESITENNTPGYLGREIVRNPNGSEQ